MSLGIYGAWEEMEPGIVVYPGCGAMDPSALGMDQPKAWEGVKDTGRDRLLSSLNVLVWNRGEVFQGDCKAVNEQIPRSFGFSSTNCSLQDERF